jgi:hypothetical protein
MKNLRERTEVVPEWRGRAPSQARNCSQRMHTRAVRALWPQEEDDLWPREEDEHGTVSRREEETKGPKDDHFALQGSLSLFALQASLSQSGPLTMCN